MSEESNANINSAIVRRFFDEVLNQENDAALDEIFHADVLMHDALTGTNLGLDSFRNLLALFAQGFPHHRVIVEEVVAQGDLVCVLHTHTAVHTGPFLGTEATGRHCVVSGIELFRLRDGKIVEFWRKDDDAGLLMQVGILPPPFPA